MALRVSDLQSDSDLDSIRNSCDVLIEILQLEYDGILKEAITKLWIILATGIKTAGFICMKRIFVSSMKTLIAKTIL